MAHVLLVDHYAGLLLLLTEALAPLGHRISTAPDGAQALDVIEMDPVDLVITAFQLPRMSGEELIATLHDHHPNLPIIALSGSIAPHQATRMQQDLGVAACFSKPFDLQTLRHTVTQLLHRPTLATNRAA